MNEKPPEVIKANVAEKLLGVSRSTVHRMILNEVIKSARKVGQKGKSSPYIMDRDEIQKLYRS